jgi:hypothetical protein
MTLTTPTTASTQGVTLVVPLVCTARRQVARCSQIRTLFTPAPSNSSASSGRPYAEGATLEGAVANQHRARTNPLLQVDGAVLAQVRLLASDDRLGVLDQGNRLGVVHLPILGRVGVYVQQGDRRVVPAPSNQASA